MPVQDNRPSEDNTSTNEEDSSETTISVEEPSTLETIQNELSAFEKRLLCSYSTLDTLPETELKLPMLFIDNFSRIFRLWHENPVFKNSVPSKTFYDIFSLMFRSLNDEATSNEQTENSQDDAHLSNLTAICDICEEEFEIIQNDAKKSYAEHERNSEAHINLFNIFKKIGTSGKKENSDHMEPTVVGTLSTINSTMKSTSKFLSVFMANECFLKLLDKNRFSIECYLCDMVCQEQDELINHCNSKIHKKRKLYFSSKPQLSSKKQVEFNDDLLYTKGNYIYCVLCQYVLHKQNRNQHKKEEYHKGWKHFARKILNIEEPYFYVIDQKSEIGFCDLCCTEFTLNHGIIPHCQTKNHILYKHFANEIRFLYLNGPSRKK